MPRNLSHLKLHTEEAQNELASVAGFDLTGLLTSFADATGWIPRPAKTGPHQQFGEPASEDQPLLPLKRRVKLVCRDPMDGMLDMEHDAHLGASSEIEAWALLEQIDGLVQELRKTEQVIERQEAQMATSVGVSIRKDEGELLNERLAESLKRAVEQTGSDAAALYLLDESTSQLNMRCCDGLPTSALAKDPRELRGSLADLEALMGNAVLIEDTSLAKEWNCPENFAAAMCLPIGTPTMPQGTIWLWSNHLRDFEAHDIEIAKAAADKILVDIERSVLAEEVLKNRELDRQLESASLVQSARLPSQQQAVHPDYQIAGWTFQGHSLGGNFHNWSMNRHDHLCTAMCSAVSGGAAGSLVATSIQTVVEACWDSRHKPSQILRKANDLLWQVEDGDWRASLSYAKIHPESGSLEYALAGDIQMFLVGPRGARRLTGTSAYLAEQPDTSFHNETVYLEGGELLICASTHVLGGELYGGITQDALLQVAKTMYDEKVEDIVDHLARMLPARSEDNRCGFDRSLVILRRDF